MSAPLPSSSHAPGPEGPCIGIVAAFPWEVRRLLRACRGRSQPRPPHSSAEDLHFKLYSIMLDGKPALLTIGGAGAENSFRAAQWLARSAPLAGLVTIGFAGGLALGMKPGEVVLGNEVLDVANGRRFPCDTSLLTVRNHRQGALLSANAVVAASAQKRSLGEKWGALAVDMESAGVARAAAQENLPFGAVKSITDTAEQSLSIDFDRCRSEDKGFNLGAVVWQGLASPRGLADLIRLAWNSRQAAGALAAALV